MQTITKKLKKSLSKKGLHTKQKEIMNVENTKAQMRKGVLEYCILSILNGQDKYASEILGTLKDAKMLVVEGTIYPLLTRLKNAGLLNTVGRNPLLDRHASTTHLQKQGNCF